MRKNLIKDWIEDIPEVEGYWSLLGKAITLIPTINICTYQIRVNCFLTMGIDVHVKSCSSRFVK